MDVETSQSTELINLNPAGYTTVSESSSCTRLLRVQLKLSSHVAAGWSSSPKPPAPALGVFLRFLDICRDHKRCSRLVSHTTKETYVVHTTTCQQHLQTGHLAQSCSCSHFSEPCVCMMQMLAKCRSVSGA
jgi:hypothetical protein